MLNFLRYVLHVVSDLTRSLYCAYAVLILGQLTDNDSKLTSRIVNICIILETFEKLYRVQKFLKGS